MEPSLFEYLLHRVGCVYISDLPRPEYREKIIEELSKVPESQYSIQEWNELLRYLVRIQHKVQTPGEAVEYLKNHRPVK